MKENNTKDIHVIYINIDGFARYYFDELVKIKPESFLNELKYKGVFFDNLRNVLPSITNPCQNMILSGSSSVKTKNVYRYYDIKKNIVIQQGRENEVDILSKVAVENNKSVVSVAHFLTEKDLTRVDKNKLYIRSLNDPMYNYEKRFDDLLKIINKEEIIVDNNKFVYHALPDLTILYVDDLDGLGHNFANVYNSNVALNEESRVENVIEVLSKIDDKIKEVYLALEKNNLLDKTRVFITTDHGMTPYGNFEKGTTSIYERSKIDVLTNKINKFDDSLNIEFLSPNETPKEETNLVLVGANLNIQLKFLKEISDDYLEELKRFLSKESYIYIIRTKKELEEIDRYWTYAADMIISPSERYHFSKNSNLIKQVNGQHDSLMESSNHIVGWIFGNNTMKNHIISEKVINYDFGVTMALSLGLELKHANGRFINVFK